MTDSSVLELRHWLHANPELSGKESETAKKIQAFLAPLKPDRMLTGLGGHGIVATFDSGKPGKSLLIRCELDALPITELGQHDHVSTHGGVSHQCGHDGHMAMVCGVAEYLSQHRPPHGAVHLLFQPAEETGEGARAVLNDPAFAQVRPDLGIAIHNMPGYPIRSIVVKHGTMTPAVRSIAFRFVGRTAHASQPELGENPSLAISELLRRADSLGVYDSSLDSFRLATSVYVQIGTRAYGVSAGQGEVHFTLRAWTDAQLAEVQDALTELATDVAKRDGLELSWETLEDFRANINDPDVADLAESAAREAGIEVIVPDAPLKGGEDFGLFTSQFPCCMVVLGSGMDSHPVHNPYYDFPDSALQTGIDFYTSLIREVLSD